MFSEALPKFEFPAINTLQISNILFPESNALQLTQVRLPGDLAMFGHIDPKETTFTLDPLLSVVKAGEKQDFSIRQLGRRASTVTWTVRNVDGSRAVGTIIDKGDTAEYEAPDAMSLDGNAVRNMVTATYTDSVTGKEVTASALVTVVLENLVVTPSLLQLDMGDDKRQSITLKATSLSGSTLTWKLLGDLGTLTDDGSEAIYTRPTTPIGKTLESVLIEVSDGTSVAIATVLLRSGNFSLMVTPPFQPGLPAGKSALFSAPPDIPGDRLTWSVEAGEGSVKDGLFTAPESIKQPYSVVKCTLQGIVSGYSIIHLIPNGRQSSWTKLDVFDFLVTPAEPPTVYANGQQYAKVVVRIKPTDGELSDTEFENIRLISANGKNPLPEVGADGVPPGGKWHFNREKTGYSTYPHQSRVSTMASQDNPLVNIRVKEFFVQCHEIGTLKIAASVTSDSHQTFYTNAKPDDGEPNNKIITLEAVEPYRGTGQGRAAFTFGDDPDRWAHRVEGAENDVDLSTIDYYSMKLRIDNAQVAIHSVKFDGHSSMVRWESETMLEDVHSITGYALPNDKDDQGRQILHFDEILWRRLGGELPSQVVNPLYPVNQGEVLISLHRREYWRYEQYVKNDFSSNLSLIVHDKYGTQHSVRIGFDGASRDRLRITS
ncbi:hypothetical protein [Pseudomonas sp. YuFO8]|uniref:hypothetical protein n=1 Tax=Pseudomonas sp. YuFO8 TaxID=3095361 RepID=UPI002B246926|nr:hypothetical protein [Pseudomonas sp. YuFO8]MEB2626689.1 hypothetical protein [Pseudomonas sp. YuFO8]